VTKDCKQRRPGEIWNQSAGGAELDGNNLPFSINDTSDIDTVTPLPVCTGTVPVRFFCFGAVEAC
jgi:hypothetical protein